MAPRKHVTIGFVVALVCLLVLAARARSVAAGRLTHGFTAYHTAAQLLLEGRMGPHVYDFAWFQSEVKQRTQTQVIEIFGPNPPTMALLAVPVAAFDPRTARALWLLLSLLAVATTTWLLSREAESQRSRLLPVAIAVFLLSPPVSANLGTGQAYLVIGLLFAGAAVALPRRHDAVAGMCLGLAVTLKTAGAPWLVVLAILQRWRALTVALGTALLIGVSTLSWTGFDTWRAYPDVVSEFVERPTTGVTAYQTTLGFIRHWCGQEAPKYGGGGGCPAIDTFAPWLLLGMAIAITGIAVRRAPSALASAAGVCLSLLCIPIAEDHQFAVLAVPLFALLTTNARWSWIAVAVLFLAPSHLTIERFTTGSLSVLAYPRLYAAWLLWALIIRGILTMGSRETTLK
jgi:hypothetical protein